MTLKPLLDKIEYWHNLASDTNFVWFPFLFLKPPPEQKIGLWRIVKMTVCFGVYAGIFWALRRAIFTQATFLSSVCETIPLSILFFFIWFNLVTANFWNRRARRLQLR